MKDSSLDRTSRVAGVSSAPAISDAPIQGVRKRTTLIIAAALGIMFGGSCDGCDCNIKYKGRQIVGCSSVDPGSAAGMQAEEQERKEKARDAKERGLNY